MARTLFDRAAALLGLLLLAPLLAVIACLVLSLDGRPVLFRQKRVGRNGVPFIILKFRTMRPAAGAQITAGGDGRVTAVGGFLRRFKLDELPQLWNVLVGEMALLGPRPEVPAFVDYADPVWRAVLSVRPGITDVATILHRDEETMLAGAPDPESYYREVILPFKLALNLRYLGVRGLLRDLRLILLTIEVSLFPRRFRAESISKLLATRAS